MKIGVVGVGVVGTANKVGFEKLGHDVIVHDIKLGTTIDVVMDTECVFVCVPTPSKPNGDCNTDIVESVITEINEQDYKGVVAIRSSTVPGFTRSMIRKFPDLQICFVPEFVRERCAEHDFINEHEVLAIGTNDNYVFDLIKRAHGHYPKNTVHLSPTEAEILKYYLNLYAATRVTFANVFYEICDKLDSDYKRVKDAYILTGRAGDMYLDVSEDLRGYGGVCLPKDTRAIINLLKELDLDLSFFETVDSDNSKFKTTIFNGMRHENGRED
jgi:UDPglucose 6-dehydrogenase